MIPKLNVETLVYLMVIIVSLVAIALIALAPNFTATGVVYQGF